LPRYPAAPFLADQRYRILNSGRDVKPLRSMDVTS
jgi:hypothetical protein